MLVRTARWSAEHPGRAVLGWVVFVALCIGAGGALGTRTQSEADQGVGEWGRAERIIEQGRFDDPAEESVLVTARSGALDQDRAQAALADVGRRFAALPEVRGQQPPVAAADGTALLLRATVAGPADEAQDRVQPLLAATAAVQSSYPDLRVEQIGAGSIDDALDATLDRDFGKAERLSLPITLVILVVAFGALIAASVPVLLALSSVGAAIGLAAVASHLIPMNDFVPSVILLIGMAVGVDYSLFYVRRAREERARGATPLDAVELAAATSGRAVVVSGCTVAVAMAGMFLSGASVFVAFAVGTILVVAVAVLGSITVLPAVLAKLGRWVDRPRVPFLHRLTMRSTSGESRLWSTLLRPALRHPAIALLVSAGLLAALAVPAFGMRTKETGEADLPRSIPIVQSYDRLVAAYPAEGSVHEVVVRAPAERQAAVRAELLGLGRQAGENPLFLPNPEPEVRVSADRRVSVLTVPIPDADDAQAERSLRLLRSTLVPAALGGVAGAEWAVGGDTAGSVDFSAGINSRLPWVIGFVLALTFLLMLWTFRSVVVAATAIGLNLLSVGAAYGLLVLVFQHTWAEGLLGFQSNGAIVSWLPMFLFVILFGLSMDYHVFVVSRIREAAMRGMPTPDAVRHGVTVSAGAVTSAAVVMVAVFSIFATLTMLEFKQMGVGLAAAILLDATLVRAVLLPAAMTLLGRWNWWSPEFLRRRLPPPPVVEVEAPAVAVPVPAGAGR